MYDMLVLALLGTLLCDIRGVRRWLAVLLELTLRACKQKQQQLDTFWEPRAKVSKSNKQTFRPQEFH